MLNSDPLLFLSCFSRVISELLAWPMAFKARVESPR